jgi:hypothetical protein
VVPFPPFPRPDSLALLAVLPAFPFPRPAGRRRRRGALDASRWALRATAWWTGPCRAGWPPELAARRGGHHAFASFAGGGPRLMRHDPGSAPGWDTGRREIGQHVAAGVPALNAVGLSPAARWPRRRP